MHLKLVVKVLALLLCTSKAGYFSFYLSVSLSLSFHPCVCVYVCVVRVTESQYADDVALYTRSQQRSLWTALESES